MTFLTFDTTQIKKAVEFTKDPNKEYTFAELAEIEASIKKIVFEKLEKTFHGVENAAVQDKILKEVVIPAAFIDNGIVYVLTREDNDRFSVDIYVNAAKNMVNIYTSCEL